MNDETEQFERRLSRQPHREIPAAWREEILTAAKPTYRPSPITSHPTWLSTLIHQLSTLLRPQRAAWCGLAAAWVVILALNFSVRDNSTSVQARNIKPLSPEAIVAWREQRRELAGLTETSQPREVEAPKNRPPQPRSNRRDETFAV